jgi:hypothetical protein
LQLPLLPAAVAAAAVVAAAAAVMCRDERMARSVVQHGDGFGWKLRGADAPNPSSW